MLKILQFFIFFTSLFTIIIQFSHSFVSHSLWPHVLQHTRVPCPSPIPEAHSNSCPSNWWCHPIISSSVIPFTSYLQSFPTSGSFQMSLCFTSGGQSIGVSASVPVFPKNIQDWFSLGWTGWISLQSKGLSRVFSSSIVQKHQFFGAQLSLRSNSHPYITTGKTLTRRTLVGKVISLLLGCLVWSCLFFQGASVFYFMAAVTICSDFGAPKIKSDTVSTVTPSFPWSDGTGCHDLRFLNVEF